MVSVANESSSDCGPSDDHCNSDDVLKSTSEKAGKKRGRRKAMKGTSAINENLKAEKVNDSALTSVNVETAAIQGGKNHKTADNGEQDTAEDIANEHEELGAEEEDQDIANGTLSESENDTKPPRQSAKRKRKADETPLPTSVSALPKPPKGIIYISRLPPGMEVTAVRSYMSRIGSVGRVWLRRESAQALEERRMLSSSRRNAEFRDGWVEFSKRKDAKRAVELLNGQPMRGGKRRGRWADDLWCLKYLRGLRWEDLREGDREKVLKVREEVAAARREKMFVEERVGLARKIADGEGKVIRRFKQKGVVKEGDWEVDVDEKRAREVAERMERGEDTGRLDEEFVGMLFKRRKLS